MYVRCCIVLTVVFWEGWCTVSVCGTTSLSLWGNSYSSAMDQSKPLHQPLWVIWCSILLLKRENLFKYIGLWENFLRYFCGQGSFAQSLYLPLVGRNFPLYAIMPVQLFHFAFQNQLVVDDTSLLLHCCLWPTPGLVSVWLYSVCRVLLHSIHPIQASRWMLPGFQEPVHALHYHPQSVVHIMQLPH